MTLLTGWVMVRLSLVTGFRHNSVTFVTQQAGSSRRMQVYVYKSQRKADTYIYLAKREGFDAIPAAVQTQLLPLAFVLEVALTPERRLAIADAAQVRRNLVDHGFHLQFPPSQSTSGHRADD
jgi:uncharacterized protein YcgL (UPF0745 family)